MGEITQYYVYFFKNYINLNYELFLWFWFSPFHQTGNLNIVAKTTNVLESKSPNTFLSGNVDVVKSIASGCTLPIITCPIQHHQWAVSVCKAYMSLVNHKLQSYLKYALYATAWDHFRSRARAEWQHRELLLHFIFCIYLLFFETEMGFGWKGNSLLDEQQFLFTINSCIKMLFTISC